MVSVITLVTYGAFSVFFMYHSSLFCFLLQPPNTSCNFAFMPQTLSRQLPPHPKQYQQHKVVRGKKTNFKGPLRLQIQNRSCCKCFEALFISEIAWGWGSCIYQTCSETGHRSPELMLLIAPLPVHHQSSYLKKKVRIWYCTNLVGRDPPSAKTQMWSRLSLSILNVPIEERWICTLNFLPFSTGL